MYTNGRKTGGNEVYDKAGNLVDKTTASNKYDRWRFDAAGRNHETVMRWYQPIPAPSTDRTETIAKTFDGDGLDVKRVDSTDWFHTFPDTDSGSFSSTEYYIRSTVLGGQIVTKLNSDASKKVTLVYTGSGVLAEQRVIAGTPGVYWRHEDAMTGSYSKTTVSGAYGGYTEDSPAAVEYDPLGGAIPTTDPNYDLVPAALSQFKFAGDVNRPEYGCAWDGTPVHCSMIGFITRSSSSSTINVNVRAEGGYNLYSFLERSISTWRYNVREVVNDEDARLNRGHYADDANWHGNKYHLLVGVFYAQYLTSAGETVISRQTQTQPTPLSGDDLKKWESERERLIRLLGWIGDKGKSECRKFLEKMGFDVNKIRQNLGQQTPYDAFKSLNDANEDFGHKGITVAEFFGFWGKAKFEGGAATGNTGKIYYSQGGITLSVILHETLHAAFKGAGTRTLYDPTNPQADTTTGVVSFGPSSALISDKELQKKLGIKRQLDSTNISKELEKRGCK